MMVTNLRSEGHSPIWETFVNLSTLPGRKKYDAHALAAEFLARRKAMHGDATMTAGTGEQNQQQGGGEDQNQQQNQQQAPVEATDEHGVGLGFPKDTATKDMKPEEQAAYWRNQSKVQQRRADALERAQQQGSQQQSNQQQSGQQQGQNGNQQQSGPSREEIEAQVRTEAARDAALALLRTNLHTRGKKLDEIDDLVKFVNPDSFINSEKKVDTASVITYLDKIAPTGTGGGGGGLPGQGRHEQNAADRAAAGKNEAERRGFKPASGKSNLLPTTS